MVVKSSSAYRCCVAFLRAVRETASEKKLWRVPWSNEPRYLADRLTSRLLKAASCLAN